MSTKRFALAALLAGATFLTAVSVEARTLRWARSQDATTLDPHSGNTGPNHVMGHNIYEPLVLRAFDGKLQGALATEWRVLPDDPSTWEFKLRPNVKFHNGNAFTADDVVFSLKRAMQPAADMKSLLVSVEDVTKVDDLTVRIKTKGPNALLVNNLTNMFIMDKEWSEQNNATQVQDLKSKTENFATRNAMGTGPFQLVSREPDQRTVMRRFENYWGRDAVQNDITEIVYRPIPEAATRVAALLSGEVDWVQDLPPQDIERLRTAQGVRVNTGPENRPIFLGMNVGVPELRSSDVKGKNPFADVRVRQAVNGAINRDAIQRVVMRGQSQPAGMIASPLVNGYTKELDTPPKYDVAAARKMIADAGYPNGFSTTLHCTNDRYVNDEGICQAVVGMLGQIGIKATLVAQSLRVHFPAIQRGEYDFYLLGWGIPTFDSHYVFNDLYRTKTSSAGTWNGTGFSDPELDKKIDSLNSEVDLAKRNATIAEIWKQVQASNVYAPIHNQFIAYGMRSDFDIPVDVENTPKVRFIESRRS
ncbi:ABC transporter substrate-binding protein [Salinarimonas soli]|uniref:ABC transporter substrate-binding protein n=1 Tax=Salinarimonas soli TaxID=1638099 RepID=A0A5B2V9I4_9HYPH|nr:ABC transporter substrate-binding protein [Salinarimonas soli]KAA2235042.1 ABC transporter substrate-binding protein [Salinarimonas soli]